MHDTRQPCPVTLVTGLDASLRRALLAHLVRSSPGQRLAFVVEGELAALAEDAPPGCLVCARADEEEDVAGQLKALIERHAPDALVLESSVQGLEQVFAAHHGHGRAVRRDLAHLDTRVTVVDAARLLEQLGGAADEVAGDPRGRRSSELLVQQLERADVLVLAGWERVAAAPAPSAAQLEALLRALNPHASRVWARDGQLEPQAVLRTGRAQPLDAQARPPGWLEAARSALVADEGLSVVDEAAAVSTLVYRARRPLQPQRFAALLRGPLAGVLRVKGWVWLANLMEHVLMVSASGRVREVRAIGRWWATRHPMWWPAEGATRSAIESRWREPWGDRRQEIVLVGVDMDADGLQKALDACLLSDAEMSDRVVLWQMMPQPFVPLPWRHVVTAPRGR